jgi:hypothetical protein
MKGDTACTAGVNANGQRQFKEITGTNQRTAAF